jgi:hypothetical protein
MSCKRAEFAATTNSAAVIDPTSVWLREQSPNNHFSFDLQPSRKPPPVSASSDFPLLRHEQIWIDSCNDTFFAEGTVVYPRPFTHATQKEINQCG